MQDAFRHFQALVHAGQRQQHAKLFAAQSAHGVAGAQLVFDGLRKRHQGAVAFQVAKTVVDGFEMVQVQHQQRERLAIAA